MYPAYICIFQHEHAYDYITQSVLLMFVLILTDMFNYWFSQGAIPGSVTNGLITLLKKGGRHVWEELDDYRLITLLNIVKVLVWFLCFFVSCFVGYLMPKLFS